MRIELTNTVGGYLLVTDEGITCKFVNSSSKERTLFFPFGSITSIKYSFGSLVIEGTRNGQTESIAFVCSSERFRKGQKEQLKSIVELAKNLMEKAEPDEVVEIFPESIKSSPEMKKEIRMKCCVCGHIFCYTLQDIQKNMENASLAESAIASAKEAAYDGAVFTAFGQQQMAEASMAKIFDYSHCPSCRSANLVQLSDEEIIASNSAKTSTSSPMEEIKKYKELLDMDIITQDEFNAKKKELLGL